MQATTDEAEAPEEIARGQLAPVVQEAKQEASKEHRTLHEDGPAGDVILDRMGRILDVNGTLASMLGHERNILVGRHLSAFLEDLDAERFERFFRERLELGAGARVLELRFRRADGRSMLTTIASTVSADEGDRRLRLFVIELPGPRLASNGRHPISANGSGSPAQVPVRRILVVEQDRNAAGALSELLSDDGQIVVVAKSGAEAVSLASDFAPEIVLCSLELSGSVSAYDLARTIRVDQARGHCCLAALTVFSAAECGPDVIAAGFDTIVTKPIDLRLIAALIEEPAGVNGDPPRNRPGSG